MVRLTVLYKVLKRFSIRRMNSLKANYLATEYVGQHWFKLNFNYFMYKIQENHIQYIQDLTLSQRLVLRSFPVKMITFTYTCII